jgi:hypothetical protein
MAGSSGRSTVMGGKAPAGTVSFTAVSVSFYPVQPVHDSTGCDGPALRLWLGLAR